ncbi:hypothetical protein CKAH01_11599 [Colletotrichum kahawae]|uniref:Uncharacterized protein n=1 Tax=Colletotrichum kahawae TaxID=34407 RepID=A0AAE0DE05_COLKA|nr:hypothetical protein CKAH01_11599 [Colletotrichum kahawae]
MSEFVPQPYRSVRRVDGVRVLKFTAAPAVEYPHGPPRRGLDPSAGGQARRSIIYPATTLHPNTRLICPLFFWSSSVLLSCTYCDRERRPNSPTGTCAVQLVLDFHNPPVHVNQSGALCWRNFKRRTSLAYERHRAKPRSLHMLPAPSLNH